jgi:hypothetical protein
MNDYEFVTVKVQGGSVVLTRIRAVRWLDPGNETTRPYLFPIFRMDSVLFQSRTEKCRVPEEVLRLYWRV